jgi:chromosome segregation ATPase
MSLIEEINAVRQEQEELEQRIDELRRKRPENLGRKLIIRSELDTAETQRRLEELEEAHEAELECQRKDEAPARLEEIRGAVRPLNDCIAGAALHQHLGGTSSTRRQPVARPRTPWRYQSEQKATRPRLRQATRPRA